MSTDKPLPVSCHTVTPYLLVPHAGPFIDFVKAAFAATDRGEVIRRPDGSVLHAEVIVGDSVLMIGEPHPPWHPMPCTLYVYLPDVDVTFKRALAAGATSISEPRDMFWGDRNACVKDVAGNFWFLATRKTELTLPEIQKGADQFYADKAKRK